MAKRKGKKENSGNHKHEAKKKYGQNFLEDTELSDEILDVTEVNEETDVIEIGPGLGFLTEKLVESAKSLIAFEIDDDLIPVLMKKFGDKENFTLIHNDFMEIELEEYLSGKKDIKVVANIPYYITSPIINKLIEHRDKISEIYLMVQKEVAERIASRPNSKNMSLLTHGVQFYADAEYLFTVEKEKFNPIPKVDSAFLKIKVLEDKRYETQITEEEYFKYLKAAFSNKRKSVGNNISSLGYSKDKIVEVLKKLNKTSLARTEEFSVQEFIDFIKELKN